MTLRSDNQPWYKQRWPWLLIAGPGIVVIAGIITLVMAINSDDGLVTDDYYKQGLAVNQRIQRDHQASNMGLHGEVMRSGLGIRLMLSADAATNLPGEIVLRLAHPTRAGMDQLVAMKVEGQGFYSGKLSSELGGRWLVSIEDPAGNWRLQGEWQTDSEESLRLVAKAGK